MQTFFHSVTLDEDACMGCTNCIKRCPTEAIRVRNKKARIISARCIDCGECIRVCPHHAKKATYDPLTILKQYEYTVALPPPSFIAQFNNLTDIDILLSALLKFGFDDVFEVAKAAELVSSATRIMLNDDHELELPIISSACPAVTRLIRVRFPSLIPQLLDLHAPMEVAAKLARNRAMKKTGLPAEKIGIIFISPCPAKVTAVKMPLTAEKSQVDGVIAVKDIYPELLPLMKQAAVEESPVSTEVGRIGVSWGSSGGESAGLIHDNYLAADGIENVIQVLEDLEDEKYENLEFVELNACPGGCVGGVLNVENPYIAKTKLLRIRKQLPVSQNHLDEIENFMKWETPVEYVSVMQLDSDMEVALRKMNEVEHILSQLEGLDCGSCGAPSCRALAEDVVRGSASLDDCIFYFRKKYTKPHQGGEAK